MLTASASQVFLTRNSISHLTATLLLLEILGILRNSYETFKA